MFLSQLKFAFCKARNPRTRNHGKTPPGKCLNSIIYQNYKIENTQTNIFSLFTTIYKPNTPQQAMDYGAWLNFLLASMLQRAEYLAMRPIPDDANKFTHTHFAFALIDILDRTTQPGFNKNIYSYTNFLKIFFAHTAIIKEAAPANKITINS